MVERPGTGCPNCARLERELQELGCRVAQLEAELAKARKNSTNSSKPPSSDIVQPKPKSNKPGRRKKRRIGGQPGHPRHERTLFEEHELDRIWEWRYPSCPCCEGPLVDSADQPAQKLQQMELRPDPVRLEEHRLIGQWCDRCQKEFVPSLPQELVQAGLVGPRLTALVGWFKGVCHMSISSIRKYFRDVLGARISRGMIAKIVNKVNQSLQDPYEELLRLLTEEDQLNVDETGHKENGKRWWTWCFRALTYTVFKISPSRGSNVLLEVLGAEFDGLLGCDYFSAYRKYMRLNDKVAVQFCLAHLIRDVKFLVEHPNPKNREYGERVLNLLRKLFQTIHRREEYQSEVTFRRQLERIRNELCWEAGLELPDTREAANLAARFYQHVDSYFRFITDPEIAPTNNLAEQAIRFVAIHRRMTQGTRSEAGRQWFERITTVVVTCEQQGRSAWGYLRDAVEAHFNNRPIPSLRPEPAGSSP
jgi:transposase